MTYYYAIISPTYYTYTIFLPTNILHKSCLSTTSVIRFSQIWSFLEGLFFFTRVTRFGEILPLWQKFQALVIS